jgi:hypothetical protein
LLSPLPPPLDDDDDEEKFLRVVALLYGAGTEVDEEERTAAVLLLQMRRLSLQLARPRHVRATPVMPEVTLARDTMSRTGRRLIARALNAITSVRYTNRYSQKQTMQVEQRRQCCLALMEQIRHSILRLKSDDVLMNPRCSIVLLSVNRMAQSSKSRSKFKYSAVLNFFDITIVAYELFFLTSSICQPCSNDDADGGFDA